MQVVLLGDSVFDNAAYIGGGPDVVRQLRAALPAGAGATLLAADGATIGSVPRQLSRLPAGATHLALSIGGNDALGFSGVLDETFGSIAAALLRLADIRETFERNYRAMLDEVLALRLPTAVCTIYNPRYEPPRAQLAATALAVLNDAILRCAVLRGVPVIDLRLVCDHRDDFANPIEPSVRGGEKIAATIAAVVAEHRFEARRTSVFGRPPHA